MYSQRTEETWTTKQRTNINTKKMTKFYGKKHNHNIIVMLVIAALIFASMMVDSECRPIDRKEAEEDDKDEILGMKWALDMSSTDEDVGMKWPFDISNRDEIVQVAGYGEEKLSTVLITGTVFCNKACLASKQLLQVSPKPISGQYSYCYTSINQFIPCYDHLMLRYHPKNSVYNISSYGLTVQQHVIIPILSEFCKYFGMKLKGFFLLLGILRTKASVLVAKGFSCSVTCYHTVLPYK